MVRRGSRVQVPVTAPLFLLEYNIARMLKNKRRTAGLFLGAAGLAVLGLTVYHFKSSPSSYRLPAYSFNDQKADLQKFEAEIHAYGGERAYNRLADAVANLSADDQHEYGHLFGDALYKEEGLKAITVCDTRFSYGCFHQVLSDALLRYGPSAIPMLDQKCKQVLQGASLSCQHGLGHGILVSIGLSKNGYDEIHLKQALADCQSLPDDHPLGGCDGGVYMEYNLRTVANVELDQNNIRPVDQGDYYSPCDHLNSFQQPTCYFWMPQWWALAGAIRYEEDQNISDNKLYQTTGALCGKLSLGSSRPCFEGIGYAAISTAKLNPVQTLGLCKLASSDKLSSLYCRSFAASMLKDVTHDSSTALSMCQGLAGNAQVFCTAYANEQGNFFTSLPDPIL